MPSKLQTENDICIYFVRETAASLYFYLNHCGKELLNAAEETQDFISSDFKTISCQTLDA